MSRRMKILTLTSSFPKGPEDISGRFVRDLANELAENGNDVLVLAPHSPDLHAADTSGNPRVFRFKYWYPSKYEVLTNGAILPKLSANLLAILQVPVFFIVEFLCCLRLLRSEKPDVIHTHWILPQGFVGGLASKISGRAHLATIHAGGVVALERMPLRKSIARFIVKNSKAISAVSTFIRNKFLDLLDAQTKSEAIAKMSLIPMGVYVDRFEERDRGALRASLGLGPNDTVVLFVGRLSEKKGVDDLLTAFEDLSQEEREVRLWIVGSGPLYRSLRERASSQKGKERIRFFGRIPDGELNKIFVAADVVVVPSVTTSYGDVEGLPVVVMEAMAAGKPIVATSVGGISDAVEDGETGILIPEKSPEGMARALRTILKDGELRSSLARKAMEKARAEYSWSRISRKFNSVLESITQE